MRPIRRMSARYAVMALIMLLLTGAFAAEPAPEVKVELKVVKYRELGGSVRQLAGKVVVVDFWADF